MNTTEPIRDKKSVTRLLAYYSNRGEHRNQLLITLGIFSALRISDILSLTCKDVYDLKSGKVRKFVHVVEQKTKKKKTIAMHKESIKTLEAYLHLLKPSEPREPLFLNKRTGKAISRVQAHRIISAAGVAIGLTFPISSHSLRKTFGYHSWKEGTSPAVIMDIFNHSSFAVTRRYLGVCQDDRNTAYFALDFTDTTDRAELTTISA